MLQTRLYRSGLLEQINLPVAEISDQITEAETTVWIDGTDPTADELALIAAELGLHPLAVEDSLHLRQRPKVDRYPTHIFVAAHAVEVEKSTRRLIVHHISVFVTAKALVTLHSGAFDMEQIVRRNDSIALLDTPVAHLLHRVLDHVVDTHLSAAQTLDDQVEDLEDALFDDSDTVDGAVHRTNLVLRRTLTELRRLVLPTREVAAALLRSDFDFDLVGPQLLPYFHDLYDHTVRAGELTESVRDLVTAVHETYLTVRSNQTNIIMKQVTSWAAIIAVPTGVTSFYGQNIPFPGYGQPLGFWMSTGIAMTVSFALWIIFRRRSWL